ncbi:formate dehydrogenase accessory sulfurtransferase FdhD [Komagataeibacter swingsii]|uniref:Sulfur carrier protein FdhD n=1 Tax=Komagataeibacter swingsii TaxID=215220 RepID=A0A2V4S8W3_9PROT|nr:formate dehydrogenase accessory sulfurtransferase FdhD [Komagataeibacter swingsii]PYD68448.1 sulfurtransferase FdhD [Komagataeibacter swingsii]GBQ58345.1 formate dehydrogenase accessory protein FdhD [Komagataeibacter swingsii DSM 16373]
MTRALPPAIVPCAMVVHAPGAATRERMLDIAEETPVTLSFNGMAHGVMMATPLDLHDFATGFALTEGIIPDPAALKAVTIRAQADHAHVEMRIDGPSFHRLLARGRRAMAGRTSCGVCGTDARDVLDRPRCTVPDAPPDLAAVARALAALPGRQVLNARARMLHAAAWCAPDGEIMHVREDVGRHNALDKLVGAGLRGGVDFGRGFCVITSRCSYEMAHKAIMAGMPGLVAVSAPTARALRVAADAGLYLVAPARDTSVMVPRLVIDK